MNELFVGCKRELERLRAALDEARAGRGARVLTAGEPGIGKTRLARELEPHAAELGVRVLWGRAHEAGCAPAYWPWTQALRPLIDDAADADLRSWLDDSAEAARILPELSKRLPDLAALESIADPLSAQFRLFHAISMFLDRAASAAPPGCRAR